MPLTEELGNRIEYAALDVFLRFSKGQASFSHFVDSGVLTYLNNSRLGQE